MDGSKHLEEETAMEELPLMDAEEIDVRENTGLEKDEILLSYKNLQADVVGSASSMVAPKRPSPKSIPAAHPCRPGSGHWTKFAMPG